MTYSLNRKDNQLIILNNQDWTQQKKFIIEGQTQQPQLLMAGPNSKARIDSL